MGKLKRQLGKLFNLSNFFIKKFANMILISAVAIIIYGICELTIDPNIDKKYAESILPTVAGIVGTIVAIVFSLMLSVVEKVSSKYSPKFLYYILRNKVFIATILYSIVLILFCLFPNALSGFNLYCIALTSLAIFLALFVTSLMETVRLMNPKVGILNPEVININKWLKKEINKTEIKQKKHTVNKKAYAVPNYIKNGLEERLLPIRDIIVRSISNDNLQEATDGINAFTEIVISYLSHRRKFIDDNDDFMFFVYTEFQNIAASAVKTGYLHLRLHPILIQSLGNISLAALEVGIAKKRVATDNQLISFPVREIKNLCIQNINNQNSSAPATACKILESIALRSSEKGYIEESASIAKGLAQISNVASTLGPDLYFISQMSNTSIMKILATIVERRASLPSPCDYRYPIESIIGIAVRGPILNLLKNGDNDIYFIDPLSSFMCQLYENFSSASRYNLASLAGNLIHASSDVCVANDGLEFISRELYLGIYRPASAKLKNPDMPRSKKFIDTLYMSQLMILAVYDQELKIALSGDIKVKTPSLNENDIVRAFCDGNCILWDYFNNQERQTCGNNHTLDAIFSLAIICVSRANINKKLVDAVKKELAKMYEKYCSKEYTSRDTFFKYCRMMNRANMIVNSRKRNIIPNVPKYEGKTEHAYMFWPSEGSLPLCDPSEAVCFGLENSKQQWKILGTQSIRSSNYFEKLNNRIWGK